MLLKAKIKFYKAKLNPLYLEKLFWKMKWKKWNLISKRKEKY